MISIYHKSSIRNLIFRVLALMIVVGAVIAGDYLLGFVEETAILREQSKLFRSEVAPLQFPTHNMVPDIDHSYSDAERPEGSDLLPENEPRLIRTNDQGNIIGGDGGSGKIILFLGGSTTECNEVDEQFRFPAVVERLLNRSGAKVQTINGGVRGHTTQDSINALLNRPGYRNADVVVLMNNINDRMRLSLGDGYQARLGRRAPTTGAAVEGAFFDLADSIWDWISYRSNAVFLLRMRVTNANPFTGFEESLVHDNSEIDPGDTRLEEHAMEFGQNVRVFVYAVRALGHTPVLMTQALAVGSSDQARFNDVIREVANEEKVRLIDLDRLLGPERKWAFLFDGIHLSNKGSLKVGNLIEADLFNIIVAQ